MKSVHCLILLCAACLFVALRVVGQEEVTRDSIEKILPVLFPKAESESFAYIHTDRTIYQPGDVVALKLYAIGKGERNAVEQALNIGFFNRADSLLSNVQWTDDARRLEGFLPLSADLYPEYYTLKVYEEASGAKRVLAEKEIQVGSRSDIAASDYQVRLYPEGGHLLDGVMCRVAFEALDAKGYPVEISGRVEDAGGKVCCHWKSSFNGVGSFSFIPSAGQRYYAVCYDRDSLSEVEPLPEVETSVDALATLWRKNILTVSRRSVKGQPYSQTHYLLIDAGNRLCYWKKWPADKSYFSFDRKQLPGGVLHIALLDEKLRVVSSRNVFVPKRDRLASVSLDLGSTSRGLYRQVMGEISVTDNLGTPLMAEMSVSVCSRSSLPVVEDALWVSYVFSPLWRSTMRFPVDYLYADEEPFTTLLDERMLATRSVFSHDGEAEPDISKYVYLEPVEVTAAKKQKMEKLSYASFGDYHIGRKEIEQRQWVDVLQAFREFPSVRILPDGTLRIRSAERTPLIVIDNIPLTYTTEIEKWLANPPFEGLRLEDIERIDVVSGHKAAIFGMNGGGGAICITTRRGDNVAQTESDPPRTKQVVPETTLYWQSDLQTDANGVAQFSFPLINKEVDSVYVTIEGKASSGMPIVSYRRRVKLSSTSIDR